MPSPNFEFCGRQKLLEAPVGVADQGRDATRPLRSILTRSITSVLYLVFEVLPIRKDWKLRRECGAPAVFSSGDAVAAPATVSGESFNQ